MRDPYSVLGVSKSASDSEIKSAFRKLAKRHHPDQNADDPKAKDRFAEVNSAYEIVGDKENRKKFDRGEIGPDGKPRFQGFEGFGRRPGTGSPGGTGRSGAGGSFEDILNDLFGGMGGGPSASAGPTSGASARSSGDQFSNYSRTGSARGASSAAGQDISITQRITLADAVGQSKTRVKLPTGKTVDVKIPVAVHEGQQIRLRGQGNPGSPAGDAIITISFETHPIFKPDGANLRVDLPISLDEAVLGAKIRVPTLEGSVEMTIPAGYTGGKVFRLRGKGLLKSASERGDILVTPSIRLPVGAPDRDLIRLAEDVRRKGLDSPRGSEFEA